MKNWKTGEGNTKRDVDIVYGSLAVAAAVLFPPSLFVIGGAWLADRNHYPSHNNDINNNNQ